MSDDMRVVYRAKNPAEASLVRDLLQDAGLRAEVRGNLIWGARGEIPLMPDAMPTVWVSVYHVDRALALLADLEESYRAKGPPWVCARCGETVDGHVAQCWQCLSERGET